MCIKISAKNINRIIILRYPKCFVVMMIVYAMLYGVNTRRNMKQRYLFQHAFHLASFIYMKHENV